MNYHYVIRLHDGAEIHESKGDVFDLNAASGVVTVSRVDGFEQTATHYSPIAGAVGDPPRRAQRRPRVALAPGRAISIPALAQRLPLRGTGLAPVLPGDP